MTAPRSIPNTEGERVVFVESATTPGRVYRVLPDRGYCSCPAREECWHLTLIGRELAPYLVEERSDAYHTFYVVVDRQGVQVSGPALSRLEALVWAIEEEFGRAS